MPTRSFLPQRVRRHSGRSRPPRTRIFDADPVYSGAPRGLAPPDRLAPSTTQSGEHPPPTTRPPERPPATFADIPDSFLLRVLGHIRHRDHPQKILYLRRVSRRFNDLVLDPALWPALDLAKMRRLSPRTHAKLDEKVLIRLMDQFGIGLRTLTVELAGKMQPATMWHIWLRAPMVTAFKATQLTALKPPAMLWIYKNEFAPMSESKDSGISLLSRYQPMEHRGVVARRREALDLDLTWTRCKVLDLSWLRTDEHHATTDFADLGWYLYRLPALEKLVLANSAFTGRFSCFLGLQRMRTLSISDSPLTDATFSYLVGTFHSLTHLHVIRCINLTDISLEYLEGFPGFLQNLTVFILGCRFSYDAIQRLKGLVRSVVWM